MVLKVLTNFKSSEMEQAVQSLDRNGVDLLMKYIYKGFEKPTENSSAVLLQWHEKVRARSVPIPPGSTWAGSAPWHRLGSHGQHQAGQGNSRHVPRVQVTRCGTAGGTLAGCGTLDLGGSLDLALPSRSKLWVDTWTVSEQRLCSSTWVCPLVIPAYHRVPLPCPRAVSLASQSQRLWARLWWQSRGHGGGRLGP